MKTKLTIQALVFATSLVMATQASAEVAKPKYGPAGNPLAVPLAQSNQFFRSSKNPAPDYWALSGFYVPQYNGYSCAVAALTMVLNAARVSQALTSEDKVVIQQELLERVTIEDWKARNTPEGANGAHGVSLDRLARITEASLKSYGFEHAHVKTVHVSDTSLNTKKQVLQDLKLNEKSGKNFIITNFNQKSFTDDAEVGHFSPVGAFDEKAQKVLILDPDREYYEPYWVSVDTFLSGMATKDSDGGVNRGYLLITFS